MNRDFEYYKKSADYVREKMPFEPEIAIVLGSGLGNFGECLSEKVEISYKDIPNFLVSTAPSHAGKLIFGTVSGKKCVCMSGRFHNYEGYSFEELAAPVRLLALIGVKKLILTNAAGGVNTSYNCGDIMVFSDHIMLMGESPMRGKNIEEFGPRFFDVSEMYSPDLRRIALECAEGEAVTVHEGVYFYMPGPQFETPAEVRAIRILGGDAVGMSTVTESLCAAHCGIPVLAMSLITNMAAGILKTKITGADVTAAAEKVKDSFASYMKKIIERI